MTEKEAIEWQNAFRKTYNGFPKLVDEAVDISIAALQKQVPEKPVYKSPFDEDDDDDCKIPFCPNCNKTITDYLKIDWCSNCG
jgi:hypothetical protein